jgi:hypothetical protein
VLWSKEASAQILARGAASLGELLAAGELRKYTGSNESATALAIKAHVAGAFFTRWADGARAAPRFGAPAPAPTD